MSKLLTISLIITFISLLFTGCGPMMCNKESKCGGMMNMSKKDDMKCSGSKTDKTIQKQSSHKTEINDK